MIVAGFVVGTFQVVLELPWILTAVVLAPILLLVGRRYVGPFEFEGRTTGE